jgi:CBS domain-containing protein
MVEHHVGALVVVDRVGGEDRPVAMLSDRDLVVGALAAGTEAALWSQIRDVMSRELVIAREFEDVGSVLRSMRAHGIRRMPVVNASGALVGIVTADDIVAWLGQQLSELSDLVRQDVRGERERRELEPLLGSTGLE